MAPDPNQTFVDIRHVAKARGNVEEVADTAFERAENSDQESVYSCIEVR